MSWKHWSVYVPQTRSADLLPVRGLLRSLWYYFSFFWWRFVSYLNWGTEDRWFILQTVKPSEANPDLIWLDLTGRLLKCSSLLLQTQHRTSLRGSWHHYRHYPDWRLLLGKITDVSAVQCTLSLSLKIQTDLVQMLFSEVLPLTVSFAYSWQVYNTRSVQLILINHKNYLIK